MSEKLVHDDNKSRDDPRPRLLQKKKRDMKMWQPGSRHAWRVATHEPCQRRRRRWPCKGQEIFLMRMSSACRTKQICVIPRLNVFFSDQGSLTVDSESRHFRRDRQTQRERVREESFRWDPLPPLPPSQIPYGKHCVPGGF